MSFDFIDFIYYWIIHPEYGHHKLQRVESGMLHNMRNNFCGRRFTNLRKLWERIAPVDTCIVSHNAHGADLLSGKISHNSRCTIEPVTNEVI